MQVRLPTVLLFGRTNVGKSTLFNRLDKARKAIVHDQPGVTRDFLASIIDGHFQLMDSGGLGGDDAFATLVEAQVRGILPTVDLIVWVLDGKAGCTALDEELSQELRRLNKPVLLAINKIDKEADESKWLEFYNLGWDIMLPISAEHNRNIDLLKTAIENALPPKDTSVPTIDEKAVRFAIVGRPNVGKSSLANRLLGSKRLLVSNISGTTRDAIECPFSWTFKDGSQASFVLVDTAGIRKKTGDSLEYYAHVRTEKMLPTVDVILIVLDLLAGPTVIDKQLIRHVYELGKACILVVNKWDLARQELLKKDENPDLFQREFLEQIRHVCPYTNAPICFLSAQSGEGVDRLMRQILELHKQQHFTLTTGALNRFLQQCFTRTPPQSYNGKLFKIYYAVQPQTQPLTLQAFCNKRRWMPAHYERFLTNELRAQYGLEGCPIQWQWVEKGTNTSPEEIASRPKPKAKAQAPRRKRGEMASRKRKNVGKK